MLFRKRNKGKIFNQSSEIYRKGKKQKNIFFVKEKDPGKSVPKHYANEYFGRPKKKSYIPYGTIFIILVFLSALVYFCLFSPYFRIKTIIVVNNQILIEGDIVKFLEELNIKNKNLFLLNTEQVRNVLKEYYKRLDDVRVYKVFPAKLKIKIQEKPSSVIWQVGENKYILDNNGYVVSEVKEDMKMPFVIDQSGLPVTIGERIVTKSFIDFVNTADESLKKRFGLGVSMYSVNQTTFELKAHVNSGFYILFNTASDIVDQLDKLEKVYQQGEIATEYIILSVDGRVIVK